MFIINTCFSTVKLFHSIKNEIGDTLLSFKVSRQFFIQITPQTHGGSTFNISSHKLVVFLGYASQNGEYGNMQIQRRRPLFFTVFLYIFSVPLIDGDLK